MSRQLDLQVYLLINGYKTKIISEDRFEEYMSEPHYTTEAEAMLILLRKLLDKGFDLAIYSIGGDYCVYLNNQSEGNMVSVISREAPMAVSMAVYLYYTGKEWEEQ